MPGLLLDIKRLCVHDGPGIRTTIFLKGCSLRCRWCHNPEGISSAPEIGFSRARCIGCGRCVSACPAGVHSFRDGVHVLDREQCIACGKCVAVCPVDALELCGTEISAAEAVRAVLEDKTFYDQSGGGCTISGGEPLLQAEFCAEVFRHLHQEGVHCAIDTSGALAWQAFQTVLPHTDLFLYDLKHTDDGTHREQVGSSNREILDNLTRLCACEVPIEIRIPTITGFNADTASFAGIGKWLSRLPNIVGVRLLPYHLAHSKYEAFGHPDTMPQVPLPTREQMHALASCLGEFALPVKYP